MSNHSRFLLSARLAAGALVVSFLTAFPVPGHTQETATIRGQILDEETGDSIPEAVVKIKGRDPINTGQSGRFELAGLAPGSVELTIQALGYAPKVVKLHLQPGQTLTRNLAMEFSGARLPAVVVTARAVRLAPRYTDFERRRERGLGAYFRWEEIKARGFSTVGDALRTVRGVRMKCNQQTYECFAEMSRSPGCQPSWWIDGVVAYSFHENTPIRDIYGIEIYRGAAEIPADFGGSNAACGVIVLWTKSKPYR